MSDLNLRLPDDEDHEVASDDFATPVQRINYHVKNSETLSAVCENDRNCNTAQLDELSSNVESLEKLIRAGNVFVSDLTNDPSQGVVAEAVEKMERVISTTNDTIKRVNKNMEELEQDNFNLDRLIEASCAFVSIARGTKIEPLALPSSNQGEK